MKNENTIAQDFFNAAFEATGDKEKSTLGIRAICKYFGGQLIYIPLFKAAGKTADDLRGVLADAIGDHAAEIVLKKIMILFGGVQVYVPMESRAFRKEISMEIYNQYDGTQESMRELCRNYSMSFVQLYRLWALGRENAKQLVFDFDK